MVTRCNSGGMLLTSFSLVLKPPKVEAEELPEDAGLAVWASEDGGAASLLGKYSMYFIGSGGRRWP